MLVYLSLMTHQEIREKFIKYFESKGHKAVPSSSLLPENDPTTLFTGSGMQPILPYLLGEKHPLGTRIVNSQKCFRAEDIEEVGDNRHTTFFEMLGNWSFGDYWKEEQISWMFEFLTKEIGIDPDRLYVTVFAGDKENDIPRDMESPAIWKKLFSDKNIDAKEVDLLTLDNASKVGIQDGRIFFYGSEKNWWSRAGSPGKMPAGEPGGPDSEMFYQFDVPHDPAYGKECHPNCDCGRFIEIGNNVFMEYKKLPDRSFELLKQRNVDFGGGLERITAASNNTSDVFMVGSLKLLVDKVQALSQVKNIQAERIIADHLRAAIFLIADGLTPSNKDRGYVLRKILRRAIRYGNALTMKNDYSQIVNLIGEQYGDFYPEVRDNKELIILELDREYKKFIGTLENGLKVIRDLFKKEDNLDTFALNNDVLFNLYQSYGFPVELSLEEIDSERKNRGLMSMDQSLKNKYLEMFHELLKKHQEISRAGVEKKFGGHGIVVKEGDLSAENAEEMKKKTRLHTATHVVVAALEKVLGQKLPQAGSDITIERLRFDFAFPRKITPEELKQAEDIANDVINKDLPVSFEEMDVEEAFKSGAAGAFKHKYGNKVKVYSIGEPGDYFSRELCGGPHVSHTGEIGHITITKEESVSGGNRRIRAVIDNN